MAKASVTKKSSNTAAPAKRSRSKTPSATSKKAKTAPSSKKTKSEKSEKVEKLEKSEKSEKNEKPSKKTSTTKKRTPIPTLTEERIREVAQITLKAKRNPSLTIGLINKALKRDARSKQYLSNLTSFRTLLKEQKDTALANTTDVALIAKIEKKYADKLLKLDKIQKEGQDTPGLLKPENESFLKKIHPKKPVSAYMKFAQVTRPDIQKANPTASFGDVGRLVGQSWKALTDEERAAYSKKDTTTKTETAESSSSLTSSEVAAA